jgi:two-component system, cell cycle sensor histidine kinase PleC
MTAELSPTVRGARRSARALYSGSSGRQRPSDNLRLARQRLAEDPRYGQRVAYDRLMMFVRNEIAAQATALLMAAILAFLCMLYAPWTAALVWLLVVVFARVLMLEGCRRFLSSPAAEQNTAKWTRRFVALELINGLAWGAIVLVGLRADGGGLFVGQQGRVEPVLLFAALVVLLAARMALVAPGPALLQCGTLPLTLAVVVRLASSGDFLQIVLACLAASVHLYFTFLGGGLRQTAADMLAYRAQKDALIAEIEAQRVMSESARLRAEEANVAKSRFLATMSHELRTPLNAILGFSEVMRNEVMGPLNNDFYKDYAGSIHDSGSHLLHLINEILDLSRIEAGRYELHETPLQLVDLVDDCLRLLKLKADAKGLTVIEQLAGGLPDIHVDERAFRQICLNLLSNAIKFTPRGGSITLIVEGLSDGRQRLRVRDTGPGISPNELQKVLEPFGQGASALTTTEGGTGLGLPIVHRLVELHGGRFELRSQLRRGTEAIVEIPVQRIVTTAEAA